MNEHRMKFNRPVWSGLSDAGLAGQSGLSDTGLTGQSGLFNIGLTGESGLAWSV